MNERAQIAVSSATAAAIFVGATLVLVAWLVLLVIAGRAHPFLGVIVMFAPQAAFGVWDQKKTNRRKP